MKKLVLSLSLVGLMPAFARAAEGGGENILSINWGLWFWTILTFLVMFALLVKLAFKPIGEALDKRGATIKAALDDAEKSRAEAKKLMEDYQKQIADARSEANKVIEEARVLSEKVRKELVEKANTEAGAVMQRAQEEIERQKEKGVQELKDTVANLSVQIAARVLEKEVNAATHRQLVDNLIKDLATVHKA